MTDFTEFYNWIVQEQFPDFLLLFPILNKL